LHPDVCHEGALTLAVRSPLFPADDASYVIVPLRSSNGQYPAKLDSLSTVIFPNELIVTIAISFVLFRRNTTAVGSDGTPVSCAKVIVALSPGAGFVNTDADTSCLVTTEEVAYVVPEKISK
jgi:hypothetical protein